MGRGGSDSGYHFVQDYQKCRRFFYYKYMYKLDPIDTSPALLFGHCMHQAMETWYTMLRDRTTPHARVNESIKVFEGAMAEVQEKYAYEDAFLTDIQRGRDILRGYGLQYPTETWKVLAIEEPLRHTFDTGDVMTGRADLVAESQQGRRYLIDHKFTGWSMSNVKKSLQNSNQATAYKFLWDSLYPDKPIHACMFNICRGYKGSTDYEQLIVAPNYKDIEEFRLDMLSLYAEIAQRASDPDARWPKNTDRCMDFNRPCEYLPLCQGTNYEGLIGIKYKVREAEDD